MRVSLASPRAKSAPSGALLSIAIDIVPQHEPLAPFVTKLANSF